MVSEGFFTPTIAGDYVVSYTITYGSEESEKKEVKTTLIRVQALTLSWNNLPEFEDRFEGDTIIVPTVDVVDNSGAEYKVAIIVKRNGEDVVLDDENSFEALAGEYTVEYEVTFKGQKTTKVFRLMSVSSYCNPGPFRTVCLFRSMKPFKCRCRKF